MLWLKIKAYQREKMFADSADLEQNPNCILKCVLLVCSLLEVQQT